MADQVTARAEADKSFTPHPEGSYPMVCVDVVNYGETVSVFDGHVKIQPKVGLFFQSGERNEDGQLHTVAMEFTLSMFEKANLRKFLEMWRGNPKTDGQAEAGEPIDKLEGHPGYAQVAQKVSKKGRAYALISGILPLPKGTPTPTHPPYQRPEYVEKRKAEYAAEVAKHRAIEAANGPKRDTSFDHFPEALEEEDDDLPF